jgi:hypothetical protein
MVIELPLPAGVPPQETVYHCQEVASLRLPVLMLSVVLLPAHTGFAEAVIFGTLGATQFLAIMKYCMGPAPVELEFIMEVPDTVPPTDRYDPARVVLLPIRFMVPNAL